MNFRQRLEMRSTAANSLVCVGLDPAFEKHDITEVAANNRRIIEATAEYAACYKPNLAFYEQWGIAGLRALEETLAAIPTDIPTIGDAKRGDIASTAAAYARALFDEWGFDAVTVNPYMGEEAIAPFLAYEGRGVFVLCRTSNAGAAHTQDITLSTGEPVYEHMARLATGWREDIGLVVGATTPGTLTRIRSIAPKATFLIPGVGAQGGDPVAVVEAVGATPGELVVNASRSIYYAADPAAAARGLRDTLVAASPAC